MSAGYYVSSDYSNDNVPDNWEAHNGGILPSMIANITFFFKAN